MKMKKILLASIAAMLVMCFAFSTAFAATAKELDKLYQKVDKANAKIAEAVEKAMATEKDDVEKLLKKVDQIVDSVMEYADSIGVEVVCEYDYYIIDGHTVAIDPLRVVNVGTGGNQ